MEINQGDIYWVPIDEPGRSEPGYTHPHVVIQDNVFNRSRITTVVVCALTTNIKRANAPGNVVLAAGEANLPRPSVVVVSQVSTVEKAHLGAYIGSLSQERVDQILAGMRFLQRMSDHSGIEDDNQPDRRRRWRMKYASARHLRTCSTIFTMAATAASGCSIMIG